MCCFWSTYSASLRSSSSPRSCFHPKSLGWISRCSLKAWINSRQCWWVCGISSKHIIHWISWTMKQVALHVLFNRYNISASRSHARRKHPETLFAVFGRSYLLVVVRVGCCHGHLTPKRKSLELLTIILSQILLAVWCVSLLLLSAPCSARYLLNCLSASSSVEATERAQQSCCRFQKAVEQVNNKTKFLFPVLHINLAWSCAWKGRTACAQAGLYRCALLRYVTPSREDVPKVLSRTTSNRDEVTEKKNNVYAPHLGGKPSFDGLRFNNANNNRRAPNSPPPAPCCFGRFFFCLFLK